MDMPEGSRLQYVTLKFFEAGHTFMSADSFHALAEKKFRKAGNLYDFCDYISCLRSAGNAMEMAQGDFYDFKSRLSQSKISCDTRPLLADVYIVHFRRDDTAMYFKKIA